MKTFHHSLIAVFLCWFLTAGPVFAIKNVCAKCRTKAELSAVVCPQCQEPMNKCLECGKENLVKADFCGQCGEPLAEMRVLSTIDEELREELRLGKSDRAQLDQELTKLRFQLEKFPDQEEIILYRIAKIYKSMHFYAREAQAWEDYLKKFPDALRKNRIRAFLSEATRQWGYLFYQQHQIPEALEKFTRAAQINPVNSDAWMWVGRVYSEKKRYAQAADAYLNALKAQPGHRQAISFLRGLKKTVPEDLRKAGPPVIELAPLEIPPYPKTQVPPEPQAETLSIEPPPAPPAPALPNKGIDLPDLAPATPVTPPATDSMDPNAAATE